MKNLKCLINEFLDGSRASKKTKYRYKKNLSDFSTFLSQKTNDKIEELHLEKIYTVKDKNGEIVSYHSIDSDLIDVYFNENISKSYNWLDSNRKTLGTFFKYLNRNYDYENVLSSINFNLSDHAPARKKVRILSRHEVLKFLQSLIQHSTNFKRDLLLFTILLSSGCRISELLNIKVSDIVEKSNLITIWMSKTNTEGVLVLREGIAEALICYCKERNLSKHSYIFTDTTISSPMTSQMVNKLLKKYLEKAKLPCITIHSFRHSFATFMYENGTGLLVIQQLLRHKSLKSTKYYVHRNYVRNENIKIIENEKLYDELKDILTK